MAKNELNPQRPVMCPDTVVTGPPGRTHRESELDTVAVAPPGETVPKPVDPGLGSMSEGKFQLHYEQRSLLGRGGMGEVYLCHDLRIGREVAMKVIKADRGSSAELRTRFLREARVQGQLEHPAIVPVYDLGEKPDGEIYFAMKRIRGVSLEHVLSGLRAEQPELVARYSRRRLLAAFASVCLAIDFAHQRGVLHRDLKPGNIMLGDFGEVYVLDWGLARFGGADSPGETLHSPAAVVAERDAPATHTIDGQIMGTLGYMAPEQARGELALLGPPSDVYALGAILFEILTLLPLHPLDNPQRAFFQTATGVEARPSVRAPAREVQPELEAICVKATATAPQERYPTARALHEAVDRFLDGDRDLVLRQQLAQTHALTAEAAAARSLSVRTPAATAVSERKAALRAVGQALSLDPQNANAVRTFTRLLNEPPREVPREAQQALDRSIQETLRFANATSAVAYLAWLAMIPLLLWMGLRDTLSFMICSSAILSAGLLSLLATRARELRTGARYGFAVIAANFTMVMAGSRMFGPFVMMPGVVAMISLGLALRPEPAVRRAALIAGCLSIALPLALEWLDLWSASYVFQDGAIVIKPHMLGFPKVQTSLFLLLSSMAVAGSAFTFIERVRVESMNAERRVQLQTWHLHQMIPQEAGSAVQPAPAPTPREGGPVKANSTN